MLTIYIENLTKCKWPDWYCTCNMHVTTNSGALTNNVPLLWLIYVRRLRFIFFFFWMLWLCAEQMIISYQAEHWNTWFVGVVVNSYPTILNVTISPFFLHAISKLCGARKSSLHINQTLVLLIAPAVTRVGVLHPLRQVLLHQHNLLQWLFLMSIVSTLCISRFWQIALFALWNMIWNLYIVSWVSLNAPIGFQVHLQSFPGTLIDAKINVKFWYLTRPSLPYLWKTNLNNLLHISDGQRINDSL